MAKRKLLLLKFKEFQICAKDAEDKLRKAIRDASAGVEVDMQRIVRSCF